MNKQNTEYRSSPVIYRNLTNDNVTCKLNKETVSYLKNGLKKINCIFIKIFRFYSEVISFKV